MKNLLHRLAVTILLLLAVLLALPAHAKRVALVVGNVSYSGDEGRLDNAGNDARAVAALLIDQLGFELVDGKALIDLDRERFDAAIERLREQARGAELALFYYAGHGVGGVGNNSGTTDTWLQPIGARLASDADVRHRTLSLSWLADKLSDSGAAARVLIIDACRNHPLYRSRGSGERGLTRITPPSGTLIAYAAAPGQTSKDQHPAKRAHGLYTGELLDHLATPGLDLKRMFDRVGEGVNRLNPKQLPVKDDLGLYREIILVPVAVADRGEKLSQKLGDADAQAPKPPGTVFRDCPACPEMVVIRAGEFSMGSPASEEGRGKDEGPQHQVRIGKAFALGRKELTVGEFGRFVQASGYRTSAEKDTGKGCYAWDKGDGKWDWRAGRKWSEPGYAQGEQQPVACVSWDDARAYVQWLAKETGQGYRLPSEAEWEYAARAGGKTARPWGDNPKDACSHANVADNTTYEGTSWEPKHDCSDGYWFPAPVASYQANRFGLYDMIGNVWEWVQDCYQDSYTGAPADGSAREGGKCEARVLRGGSWTHSPQFARSAYRIWVAPASRGDDSGFRLARTLP
ncbi:MAG: SUMF1/EgtB/PvdO family nonheme iron enzyme [Candidatus Accumulibacter meliphilus]|jgi:formylglycine-generating enzyme required for sulfatase activity|uniref:SUMF1/EgtB/PvdO family nonheme iron enzyme n=1 Tax=Candidatus Accumulibacter meliphilus TaxID=2211374 RepID=UPI002FC2DFEF